MIEASMCPLPPIKESRYLIVWSMIGAACPVFADNGNLIVSLTGFNINETAFMKSLGVDFGGWVEIGFAANPQNPSNKSNKPVTFNDGANQFKLHQVYGYIENTPDLDGNNWDMGFRADLLFGTDAHYVSTVNFDTNILSGNPKHQLVFPQAYLDIYAPAGNGIRAQVGHFFTIIGYESAPSINNFFFSHAYTMQYGEPFTRTGALISYPIFDNLEVQGGIVTGWDTFFSQPTNYLGKVSYTSVSGTTSLAMAFVTGDVETGGFNNDHNRTLYSIVLEYDITDRLHYVLQHDLGIEKKSLTSHSAKWYGINQYLFYKFANNISGGLRFEWFCDDDGARVMKDGQEENFISVTTGLNYEPIPGLTVRPEIKYDQAVENKVFNDNESDNQILFSLSTIFHF